MKKTTLIGRVYNLIDYRLIVRDCLSSPKQKSQFSQNKSIWYKMMLPLQNIFFKSAFLQQKYLIPYFLL